MGFFEKDKPETKADGAEIARQRAGRVRAVGAVIAGTLAMKEILTATPAQAQTAPTELGLEKRGNLLTATENEYLNSFAGSPLQTSNAQLSTFFSEQTKQSEWHRNIADELIEMITKEPLNPAGAFTHPYHALRRKIATEQGEYAVSAFYFPNSNELRIAFWPVNLSDLSDNTIISDEGVTGTVSYAEIKGKIGARALPTALAQPGTKNYNPIAQRLYTNILTLIMAQF